MKSASGRTIELWAGLMVVWLIAVASIGCAGNGAPAETARQDDAPANADQAEAWTEASREAEPPVAHQVWVLRHGEDAGPDRSLTPRGREQAARAAEQVVDLEGLRILSSPRLRCRQTARIVRGLVPRATLEEVEWLDYMQPLPDDWWETVNKETNAPATLLVTHQPVVARMLRERGREGQAVGHAFIARIDDP
ncbi:MAG: histidine phosphatase family protein [Phycisphaeraceae bacterium]|nr:histidine phosphatase family protein [Phycisphaeraceae bacterium]